MGMGINSRIMKINAMMVPMIPVIMTPESPSFFAKL